MGKDWIKCLSLQQNGVLTLHGLLLQVPRDHQVKLTTSRSHHSNEVHIHKT